MLLARTRLKKISNIKSPLARPTSESPRCKGFILVNNNLNFPPNTNLSRCFIDYLNYRCHSGEILSRLLARKVCLELEDQDQDLEDGETRPVDAEKTAIVFDLLQKRDVFYSFCLGKVVSQEDVDHCVQCRVCFEHSFWSCKTCGATTARLCQLCYPEVSCDFCEPETEVGNDEIDGLVIGESDVEENDDDEYTWKSLQSLSQLVVDEPNYVTSSDSYSSTSSGQSHYESNHQWRSQINDDNHRSSTETTSSSSEAPRYSSSHLCVRRDENNDTSDEEYELEQGFCRGWRRNDQSSSSSSNLV